MIYEHFAGEKFLLDPEREYKHTKHFKPGGFWISDPYANYDWPDFCTQERFRISSLRLRYKVRISADANVLHIKNLPQLWEFHQTYKVEIIPGLDHFEIDWPRVASDYDGIVISPYQWSVRWDNELRWYNTWDVASACIWNLKAIESIKMGQKRSFKK